MSTPRYGGSLVEWIEADGFGEIATEGHAPLVVYREQSGAAGMMPPKIGARCTFRIGRIPQCGIRCRQRYQVAAGTMSARTTGTLKMIGRG